jgi:hypothetical protein
MRLLEFRDTCKIFRPTGEKDEWDDPILSEVYSGPCLYEEGGAGFSRSIITRSPTIYLPGNDVFVAINDEVTVTTEQGRELKSIVKVVRDINMPWQANLKVTKIELKQTQGD